VKVAEKASLREMGGGVQAKKAKEIGECVGANCQTRTNSPGRGLGGPGYRSLRGDGGRLGKDSNPPRFKKTLFAPIGLKLKGWRKL